MKKTRPALSPVSARREPIDWTAVRHRLEVAGQLLAGYPPATVLPAAEGLTAGRLLEIIDQEGASP